MATCLTCETEHEGKYGTGRFCCKRCACSFATKAKRTEINQKVSTKLSGKPSNNPNWHVISPEAKTQVYAKIGETIRAKSDAKLFDDVGITIKRRRIMSEQNSQCALCQIAQTWNGKPLRFELDHVNGNKLDESRSNLRLLCPNCHSQTHTWGSRNAKGEARARMLKGNHRRESNSGL